MTTALPSEDLGRSFIHAVSRVAYADELRLAQWRQAGGGAQNTTVSPDAGYWSGNQAANGNGLPSAAAGDVPAPDVPAADAPAESADDAPTPPPL
jgi:hypothetical protein